MTDYLLMSNDQAKKYQQIYDEPYTMKQFNDWLSVNE